MTRMTGPDCVVRCNLINTYIHTYMHTCIHIYIHTYNIYLVLKVVLSQKNQTQTHLHTQLLQSYLLLLWSKIIIILGLLFCDVKDLLCTVSTNVSNFFFKYLT